MIKETIISVVIGGVCAWGMAQNKAGDVQEFDLFPTSPPVPPLKYELVTDPIDQIEGNAAELYKQAAALIDRDKQTQIDQAADAADTRNYAALDSTMNSFVQKNQEVLDLLDTAGKRDQCDWQSKLREEGFKALLPYLNTNRQLARLLYARAMQEVHAGKMDDAVVTLRDGYELGIHSSHDMTLINGLVGIGICRLMDEALMEMMRRPESPNLYWALTTLPHPVISLSYAIGGERQSLYNTLPLLRKARVEELSADQWRDILKTFGEINANGQGNAAPSEQAMEEALMAMLPEAKDYYAQTRNISADDVAKIDKLKVVATYCFEQYEIVADDQYKWMACQPFPLMLSQFKDLNASFASLRTGQAANPFWEIVPSVNRAAETYARNERQLAALTCVEAIRSYAAANGGKLPAQLSDITDTPAPLNPRSGKTFNYAVNGDVATLSDPEPTDFPLSYTIRVRN